MNEEKETIRKEIVVIDRKWLFDTCKSIRDQKIYKEIYGEDYFEKYEDDRENNCVINFDIFD